MIAVESLLILAAVCIVIGCGIGAALGALGSDDLPHRDVDPDPGVPIVGDALSVPDRELDDYEARLNVRELYRPTDNGWERT